MINFLVQLATDGVYRKHFLSHYMWECQTHCGVSVQLPPFYTHEHIFRVISVHNIRTIHTLYLCFTLLHTHKCVSTVSCFLPLPLALACNVLPFSVLKTQSFVSVARAENGPESCLKWGTVVYKKHAHLLKYFIGKRLIVPLRCISFLQIFFSSLNCVMPFSFFVKPSKVFVCQIRVLFQYTVKDRIKRCCFTKRKTEQNKACHSHL